MTYVIPAALMFAAVLWRAYESLPVLCESYRVKVKLDFDYRSGGPVLVVFLAKRFTFAPKWGIKVATVCLGQEDTDEKLFEAKAKAYEALAQARRGEKAFQ